MGHQTVGNPVGKQPDDIVARNLDPGDRIVVPNSDVAEADFAQIGLRFANLPKLLSGYALPVRNPGGQAWRRRLIPNRKSTFFSERANVVFGKTGFLKRA